MARGRKRTNVHSFVGDVEHKLCGKCGTTRPLAAFTVKRGSWDGLNNNCRLCTSEIARARSLRETHSPDPEKFWPQVEKHGPNDCWPWTGATSTCNTDYTPMTYGAFGTRRAHRIAWILANDRQPLPGNVIRHSCDNPLCCNPAHLSEGTRADNQRDMQVRFRSGVLGVKNPKAVLTDADVLVIRKSDEKDIVLAVRYGVTHWTISAARSGRKWKHLPGANPGFYRSMPRLTPAQKADIFRRRDAGQPYKQISAEVGVSVAHACTLYNSARE